MEDACSGGLLHDSLGGVFFSIRQKGKAKNEMESASIHPHVKENRSENSL